MGKRYDNVENGQYLEDDFKVLPVFALSAQGNRMKKTEKYVIIDQKELEKKKKIF